MLDLDMVFRLQNNVIFRAAVERADEPGQQSARLMVMHAIFAHRRQPRRTAAASECLPSFSQRRAQLPANPMSTASHIPVAKKGDRTPCAVRVIHD